mmetsp:Transcript_68113/g.188761  ORF Transcript_68113/g.188761 Transcript_68113/m.188761 type:complete len:243 (-) Transcript_68113:2592-3320(-)
MNKFKKAANKVKLGVMAVESFKSVPHGIDGDTFFSPEIPESIKSAVQLLHKVEAAAFDKLVHAVVESFQSGDFPSDEAFERVQADVGGDEGPNYNVIFTAIHSIIRTAVRNRTKASVVAADLKAINVPPPFVDIIIKVMKQERFQLETQSVVTRTRFPRLDNLQWRVDVAISSSSLLRVFRPSILFQMSLSDGSIKTFEVSVEQFHQLRYNTAKVLRDMQELERHPIMRIAFEGDKKKFDDK